MPIYSGPTQNTQAIKCEGSEVFLSQRVIAIEFYSKL